MCGFPTEKLEARPRKWTPRRNTYTVSTILRLALFTANPEIGGSRVHQKLEVRRWGAHLDGRNVTYIVCPIEILVSRQSIQHRANHVLDIKTQGVVRSRVAGKCQTTVLLSLEIDLREPSTVVGGAAGGSGSSSSSCCGGGTMCIPL